MLYASPSAGFELTTSVVIGTDCIRRCKSNYHTITATKTPHKNTLCVFVSDKMQSMKLLELNIFKPVPEVTSIKQSPVLKGHFFIVLS